MPTDHSAFVTAFWRHWMSAQDHELALAALDDALDPSLRLLSEIVHLLTRPADLYDAASATKGWLRAHGDVGVDTLDEFADKDRHWQEVLIAVALLGPKENRRWARLQDAAARARAARGAPATSHLADVSDLADASEARRDTGDRWADLFEHGTGNTRLAAGWCLYEATLWAELETFNSPREDSIATWEMIVELARAAPNDDALRTLGAGDPENLIEFHGEVLLPLIETDARADPRVRRMLCGTWQTTSISDALWARIDALLREYPPEDREGRGQSPQLQGLRARGIWKGVPFPGGSERIAKLLGEAKTSYFRGGDCLARWPDGGPGSCGNRCGNTLRLAPSSLWRSPGRDPRALLSGRSPRHSLTAR